MKKLMTGILLICIVALLVVTVSLCDKVQEKEKDLIVQEEKMKVIESRVVELEKETEMEEGRTTQENLQTSENLENVNFAFDGNKMHLKAENAVYEGIDVRNNGINIYIENNKVYISTSITDTFKLLFPSVTKELEKQEITGFSSTIVDIYFADFGTGITPPKILFLMENGTVEYIDSQKVIENKNYTSAGKIEELSDIVRFQGMSIGYVDENGNRESGDLTTVAIDKAGYAYDLGKLGLN